MRYRMIGIDLDRTLLNSSGRISRRNLDTIAEAQENGVFVVPCTGRGWVESAAVLDLVSALDVGVFVTGAMVADVDTGQARDLASIDPHLVLEVIEQLQDVPEAVLVFRNASAVGHDYLVTGRGEPSPGTRQWFETNHVRTHFQPDVTVNDLRHVLRVGCVAGHRQICQMVQLARRAFDHKLCIQVYEGVQVSDTEDRIHILEIFAKNVDKWRGLSWIAKQQGISSSEVAAIGDWLNDISMIRASGCGIAMANAVDQLREEADYVTLSNDNDGVAHAIDQLLSGHW